MSKEADAAAVRVAAPEYRERSEGALIMAADEAGGATLCCRDYVERPAWVALSAPIRRAGVSVVRAGACERSSVMLMHARTASMR